MSFDFIEAQPPVAFMSAMHTIALRKVTATNTTFVEWTAEFSSDADLGTCSSYSQGGRSGHTDVIVRLCLTCPCSLSLPRAIAVIEDSRYKRREGLEDLAKAAASRK